MHSCIYVGQLRHRRLQPRPHRFRYRLFMMYLDLAELPRLFARRWLWSAARPSLAWFRREDHLGDPRLPLDQAVRDLVEAETGRRPRGAIRLLTHLRYFGYCFNPVSFYYCFDPTGAQVETIVAEVNNTPWRERHCYVLDGQIRQVRPGRYRLAKTFHVSPFMPMEQVYDWRFGPPGAALAVHMESYAGGTKVFDATLGLRRREISTTALARTLLRFPVMTGQVIAAIHWQALRLWLKRVPVFTHPAKEAPSSANKT